MKAISLLSGGLDSILATKLIIEQNIDVEAVYFHTPFCACDMPNPSCKAAKKAADLLGISLHKIELKEDYLEMVRSPKHGYGKNINPCIDCRILEFKRAKLLMEELGVDFIVTGEVLNERPMSQRRNVMEMIDKAAGVEGFVLRPLSAKGLKETLPEKEGMVDRDKLLDINGRSRKTQMELAVRFGIGEYPTPSGGCLLTYSGFSDKVRDLIKHNQLTIEQVKLLKLGRHFRLNEKIKLIIGKDQNENERLLALDDKRAIFLKAKDFPGPLGVLQDSGGEDLIGLAASILGYYVNKAYDSQMLNIIYWHNGSDNIHNLSVDKITKTTLDSFRITG